MGVLGGIPIIEIAGIGPGPFCGMLLAGILNVARGGTGQVPQRGEHSADFLRAAGLSELEIERLQTA